MHFLSLTIRFMSGDNPCTLSYLGITDTCHLISRICFWYLMWKDSVVSVASRFHVSVSEEQREAQKLRYSATCEPLDVLTHCAELHVFHTPQIFLSRIRDGSQDTTGSQDTDRSCHFPRFPLFVALCDHNLPAFQTDRRTSDSKCDMSR